MLGKILFLNVFIVVAMNTLCLMILDCTVHFSSMFLDQ